MGDAITAQCTIHLIPGAMGAPQPGPPMPFSAKLTLGLSSSVTIGGKPAAVVDVSYGGLRLELPDREPLPDAFDVEVAGIGLHLEVQPVWTHPTPAASGTVCGATLSADPTPSARTWRAIVDRLNA
jgi:hypothetical protein